MTRRLAIPVVAGLAACMGAAAPVALPAQVSGFGARAVVVQPVLESWRFAGGLYQFGGASDSVRVNRVTQWSVPWSVSVGLGDRWTVDAGGSYARATVRLAAPDATLGTEYVLDGPTDTRVRAVGRLLGDRLLLTLGANAPTGSTRLQAGELQALRIVAAPALGLSTPAIGNGPGGTAGIVVAQQALGWSLAVGGTYEKRGRFTPVAAIASGIDAPDYQPGDAVHLSVAADRLVGTSAMTLAVTTDWYGRDALTLREPGEDPTTVAVRLGPTVSADWQLRLASPTAREVTLYVSERYRARFTREGRAVEGSSGFQTEAGVRSVLALRGGTGFVFDADLRYHTGLAVDNTLATAAVLSTGTTLGLRFGGALAATPFVRARYAAFGSDDRTAAGVFLGGGLMLSSRF